jgi:hypothetical protein
MAGCFGTIVADGTHQQAHQQAHQLSRSASIFQRLLALGTFDISAQF